MTETVALGELALSLQDGPFGSNLKSSHYVERGVRVIRLQNIGVGYFDDRDRAFVSTEHFGRLRRHDCVPGDVLIATLGDPIIRACLQPPWLQIALNKADCLRLRCDPRQVIPEYVVHFLNSGAARTQARSLAHGQTRARVNLGQVRSLRVPLPPIDEQRRIAQILDLTSNLTRQALASEIHLAIATQATFRRFFEISPGANSWPVKTLGGVALIFSDGPFGSNLKTSDYVPAGVRVVRLQNIGVGQFLGTDSVFIGEDHFARLSKHECLPGDVMIATLGHPNIRACVLPQEVARAVNKADCVQMRIDPSLVTSEYILSLLHDPRFVARAMRQSTGQTRTRISMGRLREVEITIPPLELQQRHAEAFRKLEAVRHAHARRMAVAGELQQSLTQSAFPGRH